MDNTLIRFKSGQKVRYKGNTNYCIAKGYETTVLDVDNGHGIYIVKFKDSDGVVQFSSAEFWELVSDVEDGLFQ